MGGSGRNTCKVRRYFINIKKEPEAILFIDELDKLIQDEWQKPNKRTSINSRLARLYPLKEPKVNPLIMVPVADTFLMHLARHVTLLMGDAATFPEVLDRKIDFDLKRAYTAAGGACRAAIALTAVGKAVSSWTSNIEKSLVEGAGQEKLILALQELELAGDFVAEASVDIITLFTIAMLSLVVARRALWLKAWAVDPASKRNWCKIPHDSVNFFEPKLDSTIFKVTGSKLGPNPIR